MLNMAVVGLGLMGRPIARRLLAAGYPLAVWNRTPSRAEELVELGARRVATPAEVWDHADVCVTMVLDGRALEEVTLGEGGLLVDPPAGRELALVDMSTVSVESSRAVAEAAEAAGAGYLRAPVSGNPSVVEAGRLTIIVSGDKAVYERVEEPLRAIGPTHFHVGPAEEARVLKLALNLVIAGTAQLMAEAVVLGEQNGLDRATTLQVMGESAVGSPFVKYKTPALVARDYSATFTCAAMAKDLRLVRDCAAAAGVPLPVTSCVEQLFEECLAAGWANDDLMALVPRLEREAGLEPEVAGTAAGSPAG